MAHLNDVIKKVDMRSITQISLFDPSIAGLLFIAFLQAAPGIQSPRRIAPPCHHHPRACPGIPLHRQSLRKAIASEMFVIQPQVTACSPLHFEDALCQKSTSLKSTRPSPATLAQQANVFKPRPRSIRPGRLPALLHLFRTSAMSR